jgi:antirestriction protein ArdC
MTSARTDLYTRVTDAILADLEKGVRPWLRPWNAGHAAGPAARPLRADGRPYKGINVLMLWAAAMTQNFTAPIWMTFRQAKELNGAVRKGSKGSLVVYADRITRAETTHDGEERERDIYFMKGYTVFNVEQIEGLPAHFYATTAARLEPAQRIATADRFFAGTRADIRHGGDQAYYACGADYVQMPPFAAFRDAESYYATLAHEMTHWTRHASRLDRDFGRRKFGDEGYSREELVAEIGAAVICCDLGITPEVRDDHAAYIASWLKVLKNDKRAIFRAAALAQKAVDYLHGLQPPTSDSTATVASFTNLIHHPREEAQTMRTTKSNSITRRKTYTRRLANGVRLEAEVSPCVRMVPGYPLQLTVTLHRHPGESLGQAFPADRTKTADTYRDADVKRLLAGIRTAPCPRCSTPAFDPATVGTNRAGLCEGCCLGDLNAKSAAAWDAEQRRMAERDARMKRKGMTVRVTAWIHPADGGDDYQADWYFKTRPTTRMVETLLRRKRSACLDDYQIIIL